ncbi:MAG: glycosyltransferase family 1 protein [Chloroflexi bacterium]|nr:MAG: glycosyltransferase family 1 protein [Chloroflexota bacterium]
MCNTFYYLKGGSERCFLDLSALLVANGHEVIPFCMDNERNFDSPYADYFVSYIDFPSQLNGRAGLKGKLRVGERVIYSREARRNIEKLIADTQPDIAHIHGIAHEISPSILPAIKKAGIPIVQTLHDFKLLCPNTNFLSQEHVCEQCKGHRYYNVVKNRCKRGSLSASILAGVEMYTHKISQIYERNTDVFIAPSKFLQRKVKEFGIKNEVINIPNFINPNSFTPCFEPENYFFFFGRLTKIKGVTTLLEAMRQIKTSHLYVAGSGELHDPLLAYANEHTIKNITFLGFQTTEKLIPRIQKAAFSIISSECYENYPMSVLESLACGTPVIGASIGGIPELVKDGETGLLFEAGNADDLAQKIQYLLDNRQLAIEMGRNGRKLVEANNNPETHYQATMDIYQRLSKNRLPYLK